MSLSFASRSFLPVAIASLIACSPSGSSEAAAPRGHDSVTVGSAVSRKLTFNGRVATSRDLETVARLEAAWGVRIPDGDYWYDKTSGAGGFWGGPTRGFPGPGLDLGGPLPVTASGGGRGTTTGVFINGRELHPLDVQGLTTLLGQPPWPGQWWVDGQGNFGPSGGPAYGNLHVLVAQRQRASGKSYYSSDISQGKSTFVGGGCAAVHGRTNPSSSSSDTYSYYVGCE